MYNHCIIINPNSHTFTESPFQETSDDPSNDSLPEVSVTS